MSSVCTNCSKGMFSTSGARCSYCPINTYADKPGLSMCKSCDTETQFSFPGSENCSTRAVCKRNDYQAHYSACDSSEKMTVSYTLASPSICYETADSRPANETIDCPKCNPGLKRVNNTCVACPVGEFRENPDSDDIECNKCPAGTVTFKSSYFKSLNYNQTDHIFSTRCTYYGLSDADCQTGGNGWSSNGKSIISGNYYTGPVSTYLIAILNATSSVTVEFRYRTHLASTSFFAYWGNNLTVPYAVHSANNSEDNWTKVELTYKELTYFIWSFHKRAVGYTAQEKISDYVEIDYIVFYGLNESTGGATSCSKCPNGTSAAEGSTVCTMCTPGSAALTGEVCTACEGDTYATKSGSAECLPCGNMNTAVRNHTGCEIIVCGLTYNETFVFDLSPLESRLNANGNTNDSDTMTGPVEVDEWPISSFYFGICHTAGSIDYCRLEEPLLHKEGVVYSMEALLCEVSSNANDGVFSVGNKTNITYFEDDIDYGINITYYDGDLFSNSQYSLWRGLRAAEVLFVCKPGAGVGKPVKAKARPNHPHIDFLSAPHKYHFRWETEYACRLCINADYDGIQSDCVDSKQITTYVLNPDIKCTGGVPQPESTSVACRLPVVTMNGGMLTFIILIAVAVVVVVVVILIILVRKNRKLKYQLIQNENLSLGGVGTGSGGTSSMVSVGGKQ